jgi:hypothetical protein
MASDKTAWVGAWQVASRVYSTECSVTYGTVGLKELASATSFYFSNRTRNFQPDFKYYGLTRENGYSPVTWSTFRSSKASIPFSRGNALPNFAGKTRS